MNNKLKIFYWTGLLLNLTDHVGIDSKIHNDVIAGKVDWSAFFHFCDTQWILPAIYLSLGRNDLLSKVPSDLLAHLSKIYVLNRQRNEKILQQISEVTILLQKHGIRPIFLKGSGNLLDGLYSDVAERFMVDIDFLVSEEEFLLSAEILQADGYLKCNTVNPIILTDIKHYPRLVKAENSATIEIHRLLANPPFHTHFNFEYVNSDKKELKGGIADGCFVLTDQNKIIHNFVHSQLNDRGAYRANSNLRQMYDLALLSRRTNLGKSLRQFEYYHRQSRSYLALTYKVFNLLNTEKKTLNVSTSVFLIKFDLNLLSENWYRFILLVDKWLSKIGIYLNACSRALTDKPFRKKQLQRLMSKF